MQHRCAHTMGRTSYRSYQFVHYATTAKPNLGKLNHPQNIAQITDVAGAGPLPRKGVPTSRGSQGMNTEVKALRHELGNAEARNLALRLLLDQLVANPSEELRAKIRALLMGDQS